MRQSLLPNALVTILFFLWGFAYGLQALYLGAYFLCPLTEPGWLVRRFGFRVTFDGPRQSRGRLPALLAQWGQEIVWGILREHVCTSSEPVYPPSKQPLNLSSPSAARPDTARSGSTSPRTSRGWAPSSLPLLASRVFFARTLDTDQGLKDVQWVYLGVAFFVALLIILFILALSLK
ncbi:hypothetical protein BDW68DRAFT_182205 [Aspergillus falconensis]